MGHSAKAKNQLKRSRFPDFLYIVVHCCPVATHASSIRQITNFNMHIHKCNSCRFTSSEQETRLLNELLKELDSFNEVE